MPKFASWTTGAAILFNAVSVAKDVGSGNVGLKNTLLQPGASQSAPEKNVPQPGTWLWGPWKRTNASTVALRAGPNDGGVIKRIDSEGQTTGKRGLQPPRDVNLADAAVEGDAAKVLL